MRSTWICICVLLRNLSEALSGRLALNAVFELNRSFRNEGVDVRHNPEFTMMEFYAAYKEYHWLMDYTEKLLRTVAERLSVPLSFSIRVIPSTSQNRLIA